MEISIDEAGSFAVKNAEYSSWCTVAAYVSPETEKRKYKKILDDLKRSENFKISEEIKLHQIDESNYFNFLENLSNLKGSLLCVATDSHFNHENIVKDHKNHRILSIFENIDKMEYESGKEALRYS